MFASQGNIGNQGMQNQRNNFTRADSGISNKDYDGMRSLD